MYYPEERRKGFGTNCEFCEPFFFRSIDPERMGVLQGMSWSNFLFSCFRVHSNSNSVFFAKKRFFFLEYSFTGVTSLLLLDEPEEKNKSISRRTNDVSSCIDDK